jgi:hypothetical protein
LEDEIGQAGVACNIIEDAGTSSDVIVCLLSAVPAQTAHLSGESPCTGEATINMGADTKKDAHTMMEIL